MTKATVIKWIKRIADWFAKHIGLHNRMKNEVISSMKDMSKQLKEAIALLGKKHEFYQKPIAQIGPILNKLPRTIGYLQSNYPNMVQSITKWNDKLNPCSEQYDEYLSNIDVQMEDAKEELTRFYRYCDQLAIALNDRAEELKAGTPPSAQVYVIQETHIPQVNSDIDQKLEDIKAGQSHQAELIADVRKGEKATDTGKGQKPEESMEVDWDDDNPNYMYSSDAIVKFTGSKMPSPTLSKLLKPDGKIHYMRKKGLGCKVHIGEFIKYAEKKYPPNDVAAELIDEYVADKEAREQAERRKKTNK